MRIVNGNCGVISMYKYTLVRFLQSLCSLTLSSEIGRFFFFRFLTRGLQYHQQSVVFLRDLWGCDVA
eukprot:UN10114